MLAGPTHASCGLRPIPHPLLWSILIGGFDPIITLPSPESRSYLRIVFTSMERFDLVQKAGQEIARLFEDDFDLALPAPPP